MIVVRCGRISRSKSSTGRRKWSGSGPAASTAARSRPRRCRPRSRSCPSSGGWPNRTRVDHIVAVATSAVREAENGGEFLKTVAAETGIRPRVISGTEEARLIHMAAAYGVGAAGEVLVVDRHRRRQRRNHARRRADDGERAQLQAGGDPADGALRQDPTRSRRAKSASWFAHIDADVDEHLDSASSAPGSTASSARPARSSASGRSRRDTTDAAGSPRCATAASRPSSCTACARTMTSLNLEKRVRVPGTRATPRGPLAVAGAVLLDTSCAASAPKKSRSATCRCAKALVLDYIARHRKEIAQADRYPDVRRRSIIELAERCSYWPEHAQQIARLSTTLFDQTRAIHGLTDKEREWLEYAALLHDVGVHISYERHHKHSVVPDSQWRPARVRARGNRNDRAGRPLSSARHAEESATRAARVLRPAPPHHPDAGGDPAARGKPRSQPCADHQRRRTARSRRGRAAPAADQERRRARVVGGQPARRPVRATHRQAPSCRGEQDDRVC